MPNESTSEYFAFAGLWRACGARFFLIFQLWSFRQNYLLKHSGVTAQGVVIRTDIMRRRGGAAYQRQLLFQRCGQAL